jgi:cyclopropane fatty-acyl-phospholipid synthase-like methyltransferase
MTEGEGGRNWIGYWDSQAEFDPMMRIAARYFCERMGEALPLSPKDVVLDVGCGPGDLETHLAGAVREVHGVDTSRNMIERCARRFAGLPSLHFHTLPEDAYTDFSFLSPRRFTRIICLSVIQYYQEREELVDLIAGVRAVAAPGAMLLVADIPTESRPVADALHLLRLSVREGFPGAALGFLGSSLVSPYRRLRAERGLLCYPTPVLESLASRLPERVRILHEPLTLSRGRVHLMVEFP